MEYGILTKKRLSEVTAMLEQPSFSDLDFQHKRRRTRREEFLDRLEALVPWERLEGVIRSHYPKAGQVGVPTPYR